MTAGRKESKADHQGGVEAEHQKGLLRTLLENLIPGGRAREIALEYYDETGDLDGACRQAADFLKETEGGGREGK